MYEIAEFAGIGVATLHRYVESREQLMIYLGLRAIEVVSETMKNIVLDEENCEPGLDRIRNGDEVVSLEQYACPSSDRYTK